MPIMGAWEGEPEKSAHVPADTNGKLVKILNSVLQVKKARKGL